MNYFEYHIGDYIKSTAHLSMLEDAAYRRLIDAYYTREAPLPLERAACYRLARAQAKDERRAVDAVLDEFFSLFPEGWRQKRCDEEIERFRTKSKKAKESADARWADKSIERNANAYANAMRTHEEGNATCARPSNQKPVTSNQSLPTGESALPKSAGKKRETQIPKDFAVSDRVRAWALESGFDRLDEHLSSFKLKCEAKGYTYINWDSAFMGAVSKDWAGIRGKAPPDYSAMIETLEDGV